RRRKWTSERSCSWVWTQRSSLPGRSESGSCGRSCHLRTGGSKAQDALLKLRGELVEEAHQVMYPSISRDELQRRRQSYGNVKWTEEAMSRIAGFSPLVEVGAGEGQWQAELRRRGADVTAFDNQSSPSRFGTDDRLAVAGADVQQADAEAAVRRSVGRRLLLVYPPPGPMAYR
ncbi:unnamed protein product, partial [Effrenium voratum]